MRLLMSSSGEVKDKAPELPLLTLPPPWLRAHPSPAASLVKGPGQVLSLF